MARIRFRRVAFGLSLAITLGSSSAYAQILPLDPTGRSGEQPQLRKEEPRPAPKAPPIILPPAPVPKERPGIPPVRAFVREIRVTGSTVFSSEELATVTGPYQDRELATEDLEALRIALTLLYINRGYVNSGATLPDQTMSDGVVTFHIIEGELTRVELEGNR